MEAAKQHPAATGASSDAAVMQIGLIGKGIQLSRTPAMHEAEAAEHGIACRYLLLDTDTAAYSGKSLLQIVEMAQAQGFAGLNITYPYKIEIIGLLDSLSAAAEAMGAVNTVVFRNGKRSGHNTDLWGFAESFRRSLGNERCKTVLLTGAGGAGVAVANALLDAGTEQLLLFDPENERAQFLADRLATRFGKQCAKVVASPEDAFANGIDGLVNASPVGMAKLPGTPVAISLLTPAIWVADIIYFPIETALLKAARSIGCRTMNGGGMAVFQAVRAFELFTGLKAEPERMKATFAAFGTAGTPTG